MGSTGDREFIKTLTQEEKMAFMEWYSLHSVLSFDFILSLYTVLKDDLFFVLFLFGGLSVEFIPSHKIENYFKDRVKEKRKNEH
jgi:hypothetical protein